MCRSTPAYPARRNGALRSIGCSSTPSAGSLTPSWCTATNASRDPLRQLVSALCEFDSLGIHFVSLHEGVDTSTPNGRLVFGIFASIAEFERELIRGRVRSGLAAARLRGKRLGRPRLAIDAAKATSLRAQGHSLRAIATELGCSHALVNKTLSNLRDGIAANAGV